MFYKIQNSGTVSCCWYDWKFISVWFSTLLCFTVDADGFVCFPHICSWYSIIWSFHFYFQLISGQLGASWENWWKVVWYSKALIVSFPSHPWVPFHFQQKQNYLDMYKSTNNIFNNVLLDPLYSLKLVSFTKLLSFPFYFLSRLYFMYFIVVESNVLWASAFVV